MTGDLVNRPIFNTAFQNYFKYLTNLKFE